ncbi:protein phosphatase Slingshot homolog 2b isoform X2 [Syngnathoides biaculeatus]|uniref:protein phosphatase Slingshot homolog 2b isoform X2 n=1 Tax=Syngnathoides biaculeatus TaxID=300417 RepID=UPI002ADD8467|nr:protein phosphatase Slingshot homolog 2b isoform X2 [Syngnathoides biaculeatus]
MLLLCFWRVSVIFTVSFFGSSISESFLTVKGAALFLPRGNGSSSPSGSRFSELPNKHAGDIQQHLQTMFTVLRPEDNIKLAVRLESAHTPTTRYMVVVSTNGRQDTEESVVLGVDFSPVDSSCSVGLVLPLWSDTLIHLDGDGGFSVSTDCRVHVFKPVSVQAMWSALQSLHKACEVARCHNYFPGSLFLTWVSYYRSRISSDQAHINEWNAMRDLQSHRADSPVLFSDTPTERELTEREIKSGLREIMMQNDLENVTCKEIRTELEMHMTCNLREFKEFIDNEMIVILGQMDSPTQIFEHVFLGSEWNASNLEELQKSGVRYILNVTREIDNFFPGVFEYHNIRVYDEEATDLLAYWNDTYKFITRAKNDHSRCLVHCKMGISRSAATVIAYAMKEYGWDLTESFDYVKERRAVAKPNPSFMRQLEEYQGILLASKQRHNKLWRSHSDSDLSEHQDLLYKDDGHPHSLGSQAAVPLGPSVRDLLDLPAADGTARCARRPDVPARPLSSPPCGGVAASPSPPPFSNGPSEPAEEVERDQSASAPPTAATAVPGVPRPDAVVTVVQSVALGQPYPPAALHRLSPSSPPPSTPEAEISHRGCCSDPPAVSPVHTPDCSVPDSPPPARDALLAPVFPCVSFGHADRINFFSAREKFKGMTQDCRGAKQHSPPESLAGEDTKRKTVVPVQVAGSKPSLRSERSELGQSERCDREARRSEQDVEGGDLSCQSAKQEVKNEEEDGVCLDRDWRRGSVRRVTRQLEYRIKRESRVPSPSPPSHSGSPSLSQRRTSAQPVAARDREEQHAVKGVLVRMTSGSARNADSDWMSVVDFLYAGGSAGPHCDGAVLKETWETLRELGAFLLQVSVGAPGANRKRGGGAQRHVREAEARIRQAGLTPPSLMKRSASLAKLGCLDLLANDLTDWDLSRAHAVFAAHPSADALSAEPSVPAGAEDPKKHRVHDAPSTVDRTAAESATPPVERPRRPQDSPPASSSSTDFPLFTSRQQYGRSHPVRRLKKSTLSAFYHTM